jgi:hypothetical protein
MTAPNCSLDGRETDPFLFQEDGRGIDARDKDREAVSVDVGPVHDVETGQPAGRLKHWDGVPTAPRIAIDATGTGNAR